jgi:hypothetical protein
VVVVGGVACDGGVGWWCKWLSDVYYRLVVPRKYFSLLHEVKFIDLMTYFLILFRFGNWRKTFIRHKYTVIGFLGVTPRG